MIVVNLYYTPIWYNITPVCAYVYNVKAKAEQ